MQELRSIAPVGLESEIAETIRSRVATMVGSGALSLDELARRLEIEPIAAELLLDRSWCSWSITRALRVADQLDFPELRAFTHALRAAA